MVQVSNRKASAAKLSVISNTALIALKLVVGFVTGSVSILADAVHSVTDLFAAIIAFFAVRVSEKPPDETHPYGHGNVEGISSVVEALLILGAVAVIMFEAVKRLIHVRPLEQLEFGLILMLLSIGVNAAVSRHLFRVAKETESVALQADAMHLHTDIYANVAVILGLGLVQITGNPIFDPIVAILVSVGVLFMPLKLMRTALDMLVDTRLPRHELERLEQVLNSHPGVLGFHKLRSRRAGSHRIVDLHIQVADDLSLSEAHRLTEEIEEQLRQELPNTDVLVHTEPHEEEQRHQAEHH
ncbi:MAG: cation diffusion facilitator family transporter [Armatimonadota bacterium]